MKDMEVKDEDPEGRINLYEVMHASIEKAKIALLKKDEEKKQKTVQFGATPTQHYHIGTPPNEEEDTNASDTAGSSNDGPKPQ